MSALLVRFCAVVDYGRGLGCERRGSEMKKSIAAGAWVARGGDQR